MNPEDAKMREPGAGKAADASGRERPMLEVDNISKAFRQNGDAIPALEDVTLRAARGELICLLGPSGCGKSTLLKIVAGFIPPDSGEIRIEGSPITGPSPDRCVVFQEDALFPWLTVAENVAFGLKGRRLAKKALREEVEDFLELVGLASFRAYLPREISGGMKQRAALARVLILRPKTLLMDEPFGALDAQTREDMQALLLGLRERFAHTIVFVTHDVAEALAIGDRVFVMSPRPGRLVLETAIETRHPRETESAETIALARKLRRSLRP